MTDEVTLIAAGLSVLLGYLLTTWRYRVRPWMAGFRFNESRSAVDEMELPRGLRDALGKAWGFGDVIGEKVQLQFVAEASKRAKAWLTANATAEATLERAGTILQGASSPPHFAQVIGGLLGNSGVSPLLESALLHDGATIVSPETQNAPMFRCDIMVQQSNGGRFTVFLPGGKIVEFGHGVQAIPFVKQKLEPFVNCLIHGEKQRLQQFLIDLREPLRNQLEYYRTIEKETDRILDVYSRLASMMGLSNFGETPFMVFPEGHTLTVRGPHTKKMVLDCTLLRLHPDAGWLQTNDVALIAPGTTEPLGIVTNGRIREISGGEVLLASYKSGEAKARVHLKVLGPGWPRARKIRSTKLPFKQSQ